METRLLETHPHKDHRHLEVPRQQMSDFAAKIDTLSLSQEMYKQLRFVCRLLQVWMAWYAVDAGIHQLANGYHLRSSSKCYWYDSRDSFIDDEFLDRLYSLCVTLQAKQTYPTTGFRFLDVFLACITQ